MFADLLDEASSWFAIPLIGPVRTFLSNPSRTRLGTIVPSGLDARFLEGLAAGESTVRLYLSRQGVDYHVDSMLKKLNVTNQAALVSKACVMGVLEIATESGAGIC